MWDLNLTLISLLTLLIIIKSTGAQKEVICIQDYHNVILDFLERNGKKYVTFVSLETEDNLVQKEMKNIVHKSKLRPKLRSRLLPAK